MRHVIRHTKRLVILVLGVTILGIGVALLALPGPGLLVLIAGLALLATEFMWAQNLLDKAKGQYARAKDKLTGTKNPKETDTNGS